MSNEEFRPIESKPALKVWPFALLGAALVPTLVWIGHRTGVAERPAVETRAAEQKLVAMGNLAPQLEPAEAKAAQPAPTAAQAAQLSLQTAPPPRASNLLPQRVESPNVLGANANPGAAAPAQSRVAMVTRSELERAVAKTRAVEKEVAAERKQVEELQRQLNESRAQLAAVTRAKAPPPASDREQILQLLGPVLKASNDGHN
jgi:hypothetical protein